MKLPLTVACWDYDRTRALFDGTIAIEGCETNLLNLPVEETFFRALRSAEFDVAELSLSSYTVLCSRGCSPYVALPVFLSRMFRHSAIYVRVGSPLQSPADLKGRVVGLPEYQLTAPVWVRGLLEDEYGVAPADVDWRTGGVETPGRHEKVSLALPHDVRIEPIPGTETLDQWLLEGRIDALIAPRAPSSHARGASIRLIRDCRREEERYFAKSGVFPIMHVVGVRRELVEQHPWLASSVYKAFLLAKNHALRELEEVGALKTSLPWLYAECENSVATFGRDFWSYGIAGNEKTLDAFLSYHHRQGLSVHRLQIEDIFPPSVRERFVI